VMRVLIADDEKLARARLCRLLAALPDVEIVATCASGEAVLEQLGACEVDVLLLDIEMAGLSGLEASALLESRAPQVIFVTAHPEHAVAAFDLGAADYIVKPVEASRLKQALERVRLRLPQRSLGGRLAIPTRDGALLLDPSEISHAGYDGSLVTLQLAAQTVVTDLSLSELERRLPASFVRVHRRYLLNLDRVERLIALENGGYLAVTNHRQEVPVSRQTARRLRRVLGL
jgi:DNA-binding LytR/AlgR family response regulator